MFDEELVRKKFQLIGSDVSFQGDLSFGRFDRRSVPVIVDVRSEKFFIRYNPDMKFDLQVVDVKPKDKHLLLMVKDYKTRDQFDVIKLLCGHDERHYFSCGVPGSPKDIKEAKELLLPREFLQNQKKKAKKKNYLKRKNKAGRRQGEWVFMPVSIKVDEVMIKKNEPISRGGGSTPHTCEELYSEGGRTVYVHDKWAPNGVSQGEIPQIVKRIRNEEGWDAARRVQFQTRTADANVYARGKIRHPDHKTIKLQGWHKVLMNTESRSTGSEFSVFLD